MIVVVWQDFWILKIGVSGLCDISLDLCDLNMEGTYRRIKVTLRLPTDLVPWKFLWVTHYLVREFQSPANPTTKPTENPTEIAEENAQSTSKCFGARDQIASTTSEDM